MNAPTNPAPQMSSSLKQSLYGLLAFAVITAGVVGIIKIATNEKIAANLAFAKAQTLYELAPIDKFELNLTDPLELPALAELGHKQPFTAYFATQQGKPALILLPVIAPDGYSGSIELLLALNLTGEVEGIRVISHQETPGLGDKIELKKSDWILSFNNKSLINPAASDWAVKKDGGEFDQFTGATITPRAIVNAVKRSLIWLEEEETSLTQLIEGLIYEQHQLQED